jgi:hypothetical protein
MFPQHGELERVLAHCRELVKQELWFSSERVIVDMVGAPRRRSGAR